METSYNSARDRLDRSYQHADEAMAAVRRARSNLVQAAGISPESQPLLEPVWRLICEADGLLCASLDRMADEYVGGDWDDDDEDDGGQ